MPRQRNSRAGRSHDSSSNDGAHDISQLTLLDPIEQERVDFAHLNLGDVTLIPTDNIFKPRSMADLENPVFHILDLLRNPGNFAYTAKTIFNVELGPMQTVILQELWKRPFPMLIGSRGLSKSFCMALYCLFRALFCQGSKIVIIGAAFRTSKVIFDYCETIWRNAPIFRDIIGHDCVPRRENDRCSLRIGESTITALPLGTGEKIRGQRASVLVCDEFSSIRRDIFENVVSGFAAVSLSPVEKMKQVARLRALKAMGKMEEEQELVTVPGLNSNQLVISGTAYYRFNHFYQEWERYKKIIESRGDRKKLEELFGGEVPEKFNHKDFSIMRIPVGLIPEGFMDDKNIARARVTYHKTQFLMEMGACTSIDTTIIVPEGIKSIQDVKVGDLVLTHKGRFRPVTEIFVRDYDGPIVEYKTAGCEETISVTPEHPYWNGSDSWRPLETLRDHTHLARPQDLSEIQSAEVRDHFNKLLANEEAVLLENTIRLPIVKRAIRHYKGPVYNLEVADDHSYSLLNATVHNCFPVDSDGFYKMSLIQQCVTGTYENPITMPSCGPEPIDFRACLSGHRDKSYVFAVDPASERDNCAITILEIWPDHRRTVYCWTTTRKRHKVRLSKNLVKEHDFFQYVARHIRTLMKLFPCARIAMDKMGGGVSIMEALADPANCKEGELPILPIIEDGVEKYTDRIPGEHLIEEVKFASADWVADANNGLKFDLETKSILFPSFDGASLGLAVEDDKMSGRVIINEDGSEDILFDTLEDCVMNIEEMKEELASIVCTETPGGNRNRWDTPEGSAINGKKVKSKKDRYSALLMANMAARSMKSFIPPPQYYSTGGFAHDMVYKAPIAQPRGHFNPPWYTHATSTGKPGVVVRRGGR